MNQTTIGTCSICGGAVQVPTVWHCVTPAVPTCGSCGATAAVHGPVIPMTPQQQTVDLKLQWTGQEVDTAVFTSESPGRTASGPRLRKRRM